MESDQPSCGLSSSRGDEHFKASIECPVGIVLVIERCSPKSHNRIVDKFFDNTTVVLYYLTHMGQVHV